MDDDDEDEYEDDDEFDPGLDDDFSMFADPGGESALRAATPSNPRDQPCRTCGAENVLTLEDVRLGYQCNTCAERLERGW